MSSELEELSLIVDGKRIEGWNSVRVTRSIERFPSDFDLGLMDYPTSEEVELVSPGEACEIRLGDDLVMTGYIDDWTPMITSSRHDINVSGRSKCQDLVDCSAEWPNNVITGANALDIASRLAKPYGINVVSDVADLASVPQFTINWGESSQEIIDRISRWSALLYFDTPDGNLLLTRVGEKRAASGVVLGENIEEAFFRHSMADRFSDYVGVSMSLSPTAELSPDSGYDSVTLATSKDPMAEKMRYRKRVVIVESTMIAAQQAQRCIDWEMNRRYGRAKQLQVTVDSWRDAEDQLWEPNTLIPVDIPVFNLVDIDMLLSEVTYIRDESGTHARMILMPPEAFIVQPYEFYQQIMELNR